jgi:hypothetical protein
MLQRNLESKLQWPIQGKPDEKSFQIWKQYVSLCFLNHNNHQPTKLGTWDIQENIRTLPQKASIIKLRARYVLLIKKDGTPNLKHTILDKVVHATIHAPHQKT